jgi:radical SAM superfamily enzyme YgiQ (UPF0313 family)
VGISAIPPNVRKVEEMCRLVRRYRPAATIVVGGHVANIPDLERLIDADWIVRGEGVRWFRAFLGEDVDRPIRHPAIHTCIGTRTMGSPAGSHTIEATATLIPSVGCPLGCNFCATSGGRAGNRLHRPGVRARPLRGSRALAQPAVKCRGREYLRIIYGPDYTTDQNI